jgi:2-polyprenyl-3-methyl-5-hydroxy-6-metoxy-1,4-benzoquinol methylase
MSNFDELSWNLKSLPFVWGAQNTPSNSNGLPDALPFELSYKVSTGLLIQRPNDAVEKALKKAYEVGSVLGSNVQEDGMGRQYADDFLSFIVSTLELECADKQSVLEIGCGNGYLLSRMSSVFKEVQGVEPGPHGQDGAQRYGINIYQDFFPSEKIKGKFSAIVLMSVLEHVQNPVEFTSNLKNYLKPGGKIFISVPNEGPYIRNGDVSTLFHEHWSYFDDQTLRSSMMEAGYKVLRCSESSFGGSLYTCLSEGDPGYKLELTKPNINIDRSKKYLLEAQLNCIKLQNACSQMTQNGEALGIYVPGRFVNVYGIQSMTPHNIRFFDDDPALLGTYYPGIPIVIESRDQLLRNPTDFILIMSRTFGENLAAELSKQLPSSSKVLTIADLLF